MEPMYFPQPDRMGFPEPEAPSPQGPLGTTVTAQKKGLLVPPYRPPR